MADLDIDKKEDKELVVDYLSGEEEVLPVLISRHLKPVYRFVFGLTGDKFMAEDITQEVFVKMWRKLKSYKAEYSFNTWLFSIARNTAIDYLRKKKEIVFSSFDNEVGDNVLTDTLADSEPLADELLAKAQDLNFLMKTLQMIPTLYREVLVLRHIDDLSIDEIAKVLKRPVETVKSQHRRGLLHLKALLSRIHHKDEK